jgi:hypothetical protein
MRSVKGVIYTNLLLLLIMTGGCAGVSEEAKYSVVLKEDGHELRRYNPQIVAETILEGEFDEVGNKAFRLLFDYISGNNTNNKQIPMTAPVSQEKEGEKIPMTAPVSQEQRGDQWSISFLMPSSYTMQTLPAPLDHRVHLLEVPGRLMATITYSGTWSQKRYDFHKKKLFDWMTEKQLVQAGEPIYARYNPPFTLWFMRRNEVLIPVKEE